MKLIIAFFALWIFQAQAYTPADTCPFLWKDETPELADIRQKILESLSKVKGCEEVKPTANALDQSIKLFLMRQDRKSNFDIQKRQNQGNQSGLELEKQKFNNANQKTEQEILTGSVQEVNKLLTNLIRSSEDCTTNKDAVQIAAIQTGIVVTNALNLMDPTRGLASVGAALGLELVNTWTKITKGKSRSEKISEKLKKHLETPTAACLFMELQRRVLKCDIRTGEPNAKQFKNEGDIERAFTAALEYLREPLLEELATYYREYKNHQRSDVAKNPNMAPTNFHRRIAPMLRMCTLLAGAFHFQGDLLLDRLANYELIPLDPPKDIVKGALKGFLDVGKKVFRQPVTSDVHKTRQDYLKYCKPFHCPAEPSLPLFGFDTNKNPPNNFGQRLAQWNIRNPFASKDKKVPPSDNADHFADFQCDTLNKGHNRRIKAFKTKHEKLVTAKKFDGSLCLTLPQDKASHPHAPKNNTQQRQLNFYPNAKRPVNRHHR